MEDANVCSNSWILLLNQTVTKQKLSPSAAEDVLALIEKMYELIF